MAEDPPLDFEAAESRFSEFLMSQGYPAKVRWAAVGDVIPGKGGRFWIRYDIRNESANGAKRLYEIGLQKNLGIAFHAFGRNDAESFATVIVPLDQSDAQNRLIGAGLKRSCAVSPFPVTVVKNSLQWHLLCFRYRNLITRLREIGEIY